MNALLPIKQKIAEVGFAYFFLGSIRRCYYFFLQKRFGFHPWHRSPKEHRKYALDLIDLLGRQIDPGGIVVEIGCGLGEIIRTISMQRKDITARAYDISTEVLSAARYLDKSGRVTYQNGSFEAVKEQKIDYLITVNFIHILDAPTLSSAYAGICEAKEIKHIVCDTVLSDSYTYNHDMEKILPPQYKLIYKSPPYLSQRYLMVFQKQN